MRQDTGKWAVICGALILSPLVAAFLAWSWGMFS